VEDGGEIDAFGGEGDGEGVLTDVNVGEMDRWEGRRMGGDGETRKDCEGKEKSARKFCQYRRSVSRRIE
jgi:hypothetical protein